MDAYFSAMDALGSKILTFFDPQNEFTGYTQVRDRMDRLSHIIVGPRPNNEACLPLVSSKAKFWDIMGSSMHGCITLLYFLTGSMAFAHMSRHWISI